ncbi:MAG: HlyD family type I secretion periplasmic adaptor subunit [Alphaproteobacteria bacterium]|nr:HlyD family type I secretion periplasmic adaptor subunit [Alphaproteobacteria bacterium]
MSRLDDLVASRRVPSFRVSALLICVLLGSLLIWATFAKLDEVSVAMGEVVPQSQMKVVQHFEGGIIERLEVAEGTRVKSGQVLAQLDLAGAGTNREELIVQLDGLLLRKARLSAQIANQEPKFPEEAAERRPGLLRTEWQSYEAWKRELKTSLSVLDKQITQSELEVKQLAAQRKAVLADVALSRQRLQMSASLLSEGLTPRMEHLVLKGEVEKLSGEAEVLKQSIPRAKASLAEARARYEEEKERTNRRSIENEAAIELQIARVNELLTRASDQVRRAVIRSPIDGVVKNMRYHTIGGVVKPGEPIMEIVPVSDRLVIEAQLNPVDRGYVQEGQRAVVKISTYDFVRYGSLDGVVDRIGASTNTDPNGAPYYQVVVRTSKTYLGDQQGLLPITPGMQATVDIHTGTRSVLNYFIKPVLKLRNEAFRER